MSSPFTLGQTDVSLYFRAFVIADSTPATGILYTATGLSIGHVRERAAAVAATVGGGTAPATLASASAAHTDWGFVNVVDNIYRVDFPDSLAASAGTPKFVVPYLTHPTAFFVLMEPSELLGGDPRAASVASALSASERNAVADAMLDRDMSTGTDSGSTTVRTPRQALRALRNKVTVSGGTATVHKEDDATASFTAVLTGTPAVTGINPAGGS